jgi:hypothetical protein
MRLSAIKRNFGRICAFIVLISAVHWRDCGAEHPDSTYKKIKEHAALIGHAAGLFQVNPAFLSAMIYTERTLNYDWRDQAYDIYLFEKLGLNSSIGFCQIKIKTAYFIEYQFQHPDAPYFPGRKFSPLIALSGSKDALLRKITDDSLNIRYAAAYLRMMLSRWAKAGHPIDDRPDILGTLYSTGLYYDDGSERKPNKNPESNAFGDRVRKAVPIFMLMFKK